MKTITKIWCLILLSSLAFSQASMGQARYEAKSGTNTLSLWLLNRTDQSYARLNVRFSSDKPAWILSAEDVGVPLQAFRSERSIGKDAVRLVLPFVVAPSGYTDTEVTLELVSNSRVVGTTTLFFDFPDVVGRTTASAEGISSTVLLDGVGIPTEYALLQNFPNPFNPATMIQFELPEASSVLLKVYDLMGREVRTLAHREYDAGAYRVQWDGKNERGERVASGVYFYQLTTGSYGVTRRMMLVQ